MAGPGLGVRAQHRRLSQCLLLTVVAAAVFVVGLAQVVPAEGAPAATPQAKPSQAAAAPTSSCPTGFTFNAVSGFCEKPADQSCPAGSTIFVLVTTFLCISNSPPVQGVCPAGTHPSVLVQGACEVDPVLTCPVGTLAGAVCQLPALVSCPTGTTLTGTTCAEPAAAPSPPAFPGFSFAIGGSPGSTGPFEPSAAASPPPTSDATAQATSGTGDIGDLAEQILDSIFPG